MSATHYMGIDIGIRNLSICVLEETKQSITIIKWLNIDIIENIPHCTKASHLHTSDFTYIIRILGNLGITQTYVQKTIFAIGIEQQPFSKRGNSLKCQLIAHFLYHLFCNWRKTSTHTDRLSIVRLIAGQAKYCDHFLHICHENKAKSYKQRKQLSIRLCRLLQQHHNIATSIPISSKQDDYADAFLLAMVLRL